MKKKWALCFLLSVSLLVTSCFNTQTKETITKDIFIEVLKELEHLKARYEIGFVSDSIYDLEFNDIFLKHNFSQEDFQNQMEKYLENLHEFESILKQVQLELESK
tara:strand:- start:32 stop:346 length:315 start_codon:yes stop_codon:yes gene_type:complete